MRRVAVFLSSLVLLTGSAIADEGMWTFDRFPAEAVRKAYGFAPDGQLLDRLRLATLRLDEGACTAAIVGARGLVQTNYHCVAECLEALKAPGQDLSTSPVLAREEADERTCPGMVADEVLTITDVTDRILAVASGPDAAATEDARRAERSRIEAECEGDAADRVCEVIPLYAGARYTLHSFRRWNDVRLVFGPETDASPFGGDPDNFSFPRYAFDVAFLRLYDNGKPAETPRRLRSRSQPLAIGEAEILAGFPGYTNRGDTVAMQEYRLDTFYPYMLVTLAELKGRLIGYSALGPIQANEVAALLYEVENTYKNYWGEASALWAAGTMERLRANEETVRKKVESDPLLKARLGDPWGDLVGNRRLSRALFLQRSALVDDVTNWSVLLDWGRQIVRAVEERAKPEDQRLPDYSESDLEWMRERVGADLPVKTDQENIVIGFWLSTVRQFLTNDHPDTRLVLGMNSPEGLAQRLVSGTRLGDRAERLRLFDATPAEIAASNDPVIVLMRRIDARSRSIEKRLRDEVWAPAGDALARIAEARFAVFGEATYPDADGSLRINYGAVEGWAEADGRAIDPFTRFSGLYERATGAAPYRLSPLWSAARGRLSPDTIFNVATNHDTVGGNSGSPVVDRDGRLVGSLFDGNLPSLGGAFLFDPATYRSVIIASTAIEEAMVAVYGMNRVVGELRN